MEVKLHWKNGMTFGGVGSMGTEIPIDVNTDHGGHGYGASPMELLLMSLCGCSGMDIISIMQKKKQAVTFFEIIARAERAMEHPRVFTNIMVEYIFTGKNLDRKAAEQAVELSITRYCSAYAMISKAARIDPHITLVEEPLSGIPG